MKKEVIALFDRIRRKIGEQLMKVMKDKGGSGSSTGGPPQEPGDQDLKKPLPYRPDENRSASSPLKG